MKLVSTTIAGPGSAATIGKALASVAALVDCIIVLANAPDDDENERIIAASEAAIIAKRTELHGHAGTPPDLLAKAFVWKNDFSAARNHALDVAAAHGADWCLWVDTDEWLESVSPAHPEEAPRFLREQLTHTPHGALMMMHASGTYSQPRLIRVPTAARWEGRTHECFPAYRLGQGDVHGLRFNEGPKTRQQFEAKFRRDEQILTEEVEKNPGDARSWFYLGQTKKDLGDVSGAIRAYDRRAMLKGWNEESAWACYRCAECLIELGHFEAAIERCVTGLGLHAGIAELAWLAGWCNYQLQRFDQAIHWAQMAVAGGEYKGLRNISQRIGFRHPPALYEEPYGVIQHAARELGKPGLEQFAEREYRLALGSRKQAGF